MAIFVDKGHSQDPHTMGGAFIRRVCLLRRIQYVYIVLCQVTLTCRLREIMQIKYMQISYMANNVDKQCRVVMLCDDIIQMVNRASFLSHINDFSHTVWTIDLSLFGFCHHVTTKHDHMILFTNIICHVAN